MIHLIERNDVIERIFLPWRLQLGEACDPYKHHAYRVLNLTWALLDSRREQLTERYGGEPEILERIAIAAAYHDVGVWLDKTLDYLGPSKVRAGECLSTPYKRKWADEIGLMIEWHHKLTPYEGDHAVLVEPFRRADLCDLTYGHIRYGLPRRFVRDLYRRFPNLGFQRIVYGAVVKYALTHPWRPMPMLRK